MSVRVLDQVWKSSQQRGNPLLVLLALADFADEDGIAFPSMGRLAKKTRLGGRALRRIEAELVTSGELCVERKPGHANVFRLAGMSVRTQEPRAGGSVRNGESRGEDSGVQGGRAGESRVGRAGESSITVTLKPSLEPSVNRHAPAGAHEPATQNFTEHETTCPILPHTFSGSYSDHLENDSRHQVHKR